MPREKIPYRAVLDYVGSVIWVPPVNADTAPIYRGSVPAIEAIMADGRRVYVSFETTFSSADTRDRYIARMRKMAATITAAADRAEREAT
jgi:hypothetical protein